jgi:hypothetical protein
VHSVRNHRSCRVAKDAGFSVEGIKRSLQRYEQGGFHDMHLHARVRPAETPARAWDRALLGLVSHTRLWTAASLLSAACALLALVFRYAALLPLAMVAAVLLMRVNHSYRPFRRRSRFRPVEAGPHRFLQR